MQVLDAKNSDTAQFFLDGCSDVLRNGCTTLSDILSSLIGPNGSLKLLSGSSCSFTNDGAYLLSNLSLNSSFLQLLVDSSRCQDSFEGDGTTSVALLACLLFLECSALPVHPFFVIRALSVVESVCCDFLDSVCFLGDPHFLASTALCSKVVRGHLNLFSRICVQASGRCPTISETPYNESKELGEREFKGSCDRTHVLNFNEKNDIQVDDKGEINRLKTQTSPEKMDEINNSSKILRGNTQIYNEKKVDNENTSINSSNFDDIKVQNYSPSKIQDSGRKCPKKNFQRVVFNSEESTERRPYLKNDLNCSSDESEIELHRSAVSILRLPGSLGQSFYLSNTILLKSDAKVPKIKNPKILLANTATDADRPKVAGGAVRASTLSQLASIERGEQLRMENKAKAIADTGCDIFVNRQIIYDLPRAELQRLGVHAIGLASFDGIARLHSALSASIHSVFAQTKGEPHSLKNAKNIGKDSNNEKNIKSKKQLTMPSTKESKPALIDIEFNSNISDQTNKKDIQPPNQTLKDVVSSSDSFENPLGSKSPIHPSHVNPSISENFKVSNNSSHESSLNPIRNTNNDDSAGHVDENKNSITNTPLNNSHQPPNNDNIFQGSKLAGCKEVYSTTLCGTPVVVFNGTKRGGTIVLRGSSEEVLNEAERALNDGLSAVRSLKAVPGGCAVEAAISRKLEKLSKETHSNEAAGIEAAARAFIRFTGILANNCGMDSEKTKAILKSNDMDKYNNTNKYTSNKNIPTLIGIDAEKGEICDTAARGIYESYSVRKRVFQSAIETAQTLLRVDGIIQAPPRERKKM